MRQTIDTYDKIETYTVETYAVFRNIDKSILATNNFVEKFGYKFICIDLGDLEKYFSSLFSIPKNFISEYQVHLQDSNISISHGFCEALINDREFGNIVLMEKEVIFLKSIEEFEQEVINNTINIEKAIQHAGKLQSFVTALIQQFRLFKNGDISCFTQFQIAKETRQVTSKLSSTPSRTCGHKIYTITQEESGQLSKIFTDTFSPNKLTELAVSNFNLSYDISDVKTRYITLMTCLESLFNQGKDQITHTVSRHLAIIISKTKDEFENNYNKIKQLYNLRSTIVHGDRTNKDLYKATDELQNMVRDAINFCLAIKLNKKQLFDQLNSSGFVNSADIIN